MDALREAVLGELRQLLHEFRADPMLLRPEARLVADIGLDSLEMASAAIALEARFGVDLMDALDEDTTVAGLLDVIASTPAAADGDR